MRNEELGVRNDFCRSKESAGAIGVQPGRENRKNYLTVNEHLIVLEQFLIPHS